MSPLGWPGSRVQAPIFVRMVVAINMAISVVLVVAMVELGMRVYLLVKLLPVVEILAVGELGMLVILLLMLLLPIILDVTAIALGMLALLLLKLLCVVLVVAAFRSRTFRENPAKILLQLLAATVVGVSCLIGFAPAGDGTGRANRAVNPIRLAVKAAV